MANNDRVADVYYRRIDTTQTQDACRDRVHWLCERAIGRRVLDVGCSQGITSLILAREGHEVVGLDIEADPLAAAAEALAREPAPVQQRVHLVHADAFTAEFEPGSFDAAILGEILEHLASPERLLERVAGWLIEDGRVVVTVPHGYHPYHDHKRSYYVGSLVELLTQRFTVVGIELIADRFLGAVAMKPPVGRPPPQLAVEQLLSWERLSYEAIERAERQIHGDGLAWQARRRKWGERVAKLHETVTSRQQDLHQAREELAAQRKAAEELRAAVTSRQQDLDQARQELADQRKAAAELRERHAQETEELRRQVRSAQAELPALEQRLAQATQEALRRAEQLEKSTKTAAEQIARSKADAEKQRKDLEKAYELEQRRRRQAEARIARLEAQIATYKAESVLAKQQVRYRLGDAFVRAATPSTDTLRLPFRFLALLREGLRRRRTRRATEEAAQSAPVAPMPVAETPPPPAQPPPPVAEADPNCGIATTAPLAVAPAPPVVSLDSIPTLAEAFSSTPLELRRRSDLRIAAVTDEFSWRAWQYEADVYTFTPKTWREVLEERRPDLLLIESTWSGLGDTWYFQVRDLGKRGDVIRYYALPDVVAWCRARGIPTVFYNKEDPPNFDVFVDAAMQFDFVFTSDANCIPAYRKHVRHDRVYALPFAAQPRIHNPTMTGTRTGSVCFAGTWYAHRHFDRQNDAETILRPALDFDLHIFDRMANSDNPNYRWPDAFLPALRGALPYAQMLATYKRYKVFMNINSVVNSPTMFSRRVFELLACGTPVISSRSAGIEQVLGDDVVLMSESEQRTRELLEKLLGNDEYRERLALRGQRKVFGEHTYTHRLQTMLDTIGLRAAPVGRPGLSMIAAVENAAEAAAAWEHFCRQSYAQRQLVLVARDAAAVEGLERVTGSAAPVHIVRLAEGAHWGRGLSQAVQEVDAEYVTALNPRSFYGAHYLADYANVALYVSEPAFGKACYYCTGAAGPRVVGKGNEYRVVSKVNPWTLCLSRQWAVQLARRLASAQSPEEWWNRAMRAQPRVYAADRFNYVQAGPAAGHPEGTAGLLHETEPAIV